MNIHFTKIRLAVAIAIIVALVPATAVATHLFDDVDDSRFFADPVKWASDNGITTGSPAGATTFKPLDGVTRGESVTFLKRYDDNIVQPALTDRYTKAEVDAVDAALAAAAPKLLTTSVPSGSGTVVSTTSMTFVPIPGMTLDVVVPAGGSWRALITFSGESNCFQDPVGGVFCLVRAIVDPGGTIAPPGVVIFDSVEHDFTGAPDSLAWGTHSQQWTTELSPGTHTIVMQYSVDETSATFHMDARMLSIQLFPV